MFFLKKISYFSKLILINILVLFLILFSLEIITRIVIIIKFNKTSMGLTERTNYLSYQPFTMFGKDYYNFFENVKNNIDYNQYNILLLGGSTAEGFNSKILENEITKVINKKINVFNAASSSFNSSQELIVLSKSLDINFDLIVTLSGANDLLHSIIPSNKVGTFYLNETYSIILNKPYLSPFVYLLQNSQLFKIIDRFKKVNQIKKDSQIYFEHANYLVQNISRSNKLSKLNSSNYIFVLQPYLGFKKNLSEYEKNFTIYEYRDDTIKSLYNYVDEKLKKENLISDLNYLDGRFIYETKKTIFSDDVHFKDDNGYLVLAKEIAKKLSKILTY
tara:strand:+ start:276 stop:1274 length:999 start_codon:yes stop_codon:yes gene_type:complete